MADTEIEAVSARTGVPSATVKKILDAQLSFLFALGLVYPNDERRGEYLRQKYPDLVRPSVADRAGRSPSTPVEHELEATGVQLESGERMQTVVEVIAGYYEVTGIVDPHGIAQYRRWANEWTTER